jgi:hypothetical protein
MIAIIHIAADKLCVPGCFCGLKIYNAVDREICYYPESRINIDFYDAVSNYGLSCLLRTKQSQHQAVGDLIARKLENIGKYKFKSLINLIARAYESLG